MSRHVLVPIDGSDQSEKAFEHVLAEHPDATITLIHVLNPVSVMGYADDEAFDVEAYQQAERNQRNRAETMLTEYRDTATDGGHETDVIVTKGKPARQILKAAEERDVDHIVMGSRGRSGVGRVLFGSVAETVTRRAGVPVTIVR